MGSIKRLVVGLPVYNGENYVDEAVRAVRSQSFDDFSIVVSDNASTDATMDIVKHHAAEDDRMLLIRQDHNLGAAPNYNIVYRDSPASDYFCWLAHDDVPLPRFLEACVAALDADPEAVLAFTATKLIDSYGNEIGLAPSRPKLLSPEAHVRFADVIEHRNSNHPIFGVIRRTALDRTNLHGSYTGSDRVLLAELALLGRYVEVPDLLFAVREHTERSVRGGGHASGKSRDAWFDTTRAGRILFPRWLRLRNYAGAIIASPISTSERMRCFGALFRWLVRGNWKTLMFDLTTAGRQITAMAARRIRRN